MTGLTNQSDSIFKTWHNRMLGGGGLFVFLIGIGVGLPPPLSANFETEHKQNATFYIFEDQNQRWLVINFS